MAEFTMPSLGADMDSGKLVEWLVAPGDIVHKGDIVAVVDTAKADVEVETFQEGVVEALLVPEGIEVPVGTPLATIRSGTESTPEPAPKAGPTTAARRKRPRAAPPPPSRGSQVRVSSPLARHRAMELDVDLEGVVGTGRGGAVTRADVERAAHARATTRPAGRRQVSPYARRLAAELGVDVDSLPRSTQPVRADDVRRAAERAPSAPQQAPQQVPPTRPAARVTDMRTAIARLMVRSKREIPHYYLSTTLDLGAALRWMHEKNLDLPIAERLVPAALLLKATAVAAREHPELNGFWVDEAFVPGPGVHLGVAVSLRTGGLVAPALHDAADLGVEELMSALRDLVSRARTGRLRGSEIADPTLTVTNLGDQGVDSVFGVIYPPQVALVGFGRITEQPVAVDGLLGVRPVTVLTLAADHRATDGFTGARFLDTIDRLLQQPEDL